MFNTYTSNLDLGYYELFPNYGYTLNKIPDILLNQLDTPINNLKSNFAQGIKYNDELVGEIEHEYIFSLPRDLKKYIQSLAETLEKESNYIKKYTELKNIQQLDINTWVNFQKKYEYNPLHLHSGIFSFVIWYKIPYSLEEEKKYIKSGLADFVNGSFNFVYALANEKIPLIKGIELPIDKTKEGYIAMFPSSLLHIVYPFYTSDEYRITIAGNIITR